MPQLDPTWFASQLFWLAVAFVTLYVVLARWALPRIQSVLALRAGTISSDLERAQRMTAEADRARQDYERTLADARARAQQLFLEAVSQQKAKAESANRAMDVKIAGMLGDAAKKIDSKKQELMTALTPASKELADMIVGKLTQPARDSVISLSDAVKLRNR